MNALSTTRCQQGHNREPTKEAIQTYTDYRPAIDGLRGLAILMVLLFHANLGMSGGFIGVDVFFVLSGYLITKIVKKQFQDGVFSILDFSCRRICRILPALQTTIAFCILFGFFFQLPAAYKDFAASACYQQTLAANVYFWRNTGYFSGDADLKPLLHTWSLAIEEQFYIIFPIVAVLLRRRSSYQIFIAIILIFLISLTLSEYASHYHRSAAFFLLPSRAWELLLGAITSLLPENSPTRTSAKKLLSTASLGLILLLGIVYDKSITFPGITAAIPCVATAIILYLSNNAQHTPKLLNNPILSSIGLISYSLYLWHWPIFAYSRELLGINLPFFARVFFITLSIAVAYISWKFIEQPFRGLKKKGRISILLLTSIPVLYGISFYISESDGLTSRVPHRFLMYQQASKSMDYINEISVEDASAGRFPVYGNRSSKRSFVVWGDSHAMSLMPGIVAAATKHKIKIVQATHSSTPPLVNFVDHYESGLNEKNPLFANSVIKYCTSNNVEAVILAGVWASYARHKGFEVQLKETIKLLESSGITVVIVLDIPTQDYGPLEFSTRAWWNLSADLQIPKAQHFADNALANGMLNKSATSSTIVIDPSSYFQKGDYFIAQSEDTVYYRDSQHLSIEGGLHLEPLFSTLFLNNAERR